MIIIVFLIIGVVLLVAVVLILLRVVGGLLRKVGPNEALIIYGTGGLKVVTGGAHLVLPLYQRAKIFSLELLSFNIAQSLFTVQGIAVNVEANIQIKVRGDEQSIRTAAEQLLSKPQQERENLLGQAMKGQLRGIVGQLTVENLVKDQESVNNQMLRVVARDMERMGLEVVSFTIREIREGNNYISDMGRPQIEENRKRADIATALARRDTQIQQANAAREAAIAKAHAEQERIQVENEAQALQAQSQRDLALKQATFDVEVKRQQAIADKAYDIQANIIQQQIVAEAVKVTEIETQARIKVQEAELQRRELELQATVLKAAEAERQRLLLLSDARTKDAKSTGVTEAEITRARGLAEAEVIRARGLAEAEAIRERITLEAEGQAKAIKARGLAQAEVAHVHGQAEAEAIRARGSAEAEAMKLKAIAYQEYNQAAVLDKLFPVIPELARAIAEPLSKVDKVTIVSTGTGGNGSDGNSLGASRLTGEIVNMAAQVPALFELLSGGTTISDLISRVPALSSKDDVSNNGAKTNITTQQPGGEAGGGSQG